MAVTIETIAVALGRTVPSDPEAAQWEMWISDALMLITARLGDPALLDQGILDYVVREAVVSHIRKPDDATQVSVSVDDASTSRTYRTSKGRVSIISEWWELLAPSKSAGAFSFRPYGSGSGGHAEICSANRYVDAQGNVVFGGAFCSCGAEYTNYQYPLYEGGILSVDPE